MYDPGFPSPPPPVHGTLPLCGVGGGGGGGWWWWVVVEVVVVEAVLVW